MGPARHTLSSLAGRITGGTNSREMERYGAIASAVVAQEPLVTALSDSALTHQADLLRLRARRTESTEVTDTTSLDELLIQTYALVREAARRVIGLRAFTSQLVASIALHSGRLAELPTGEGKTLAAAFPATLNALTGDGVHVLTFNDYLARRDADWMGGVYRLLGLSVGCVQEGQPIHARQRAYSSDITYVSAKEDGFDYLRDHRCTQATDLVQRGFHYAIVDEADSILIDEARVPLILAGSMPAGNEPVKRVTAVVGALVASVDYEIGSNGRNVFLTERGTDRVEASLGCGNLYSESNGHLLSLVQHALHARALLRRDVDYLVRDGIVEIIDELTGRVEELRRWPDGLHAAVTAKENLAAPPQGEILGSITIQHLLQLYPKRAGMTATAQPSAAEFLGVYGLTVVVIPPNRPCIRQDLPDVVFSSCAAKEVALRDEIIRVHATGRPILVGTASVAESERCATALREAGINCAVLNAKDDEQEARIIADAGGSGAVTISTNMAGRGTDIRLGDEVHDHEQVAALGGLYVIGTHRHESPRSDLQLRGRAGRQGDPGSSRFFISLDDELVQRYGLRDSIPQLQDLHASSSSISDPTVTAEIDRAQRIVDAHNYTRRRTLERYSALLAKQRTLIYEWRQAVLTSRAVAGFIEQRAENRCAEVRQQFGEATLCEVARSLTLFHIDRAWSDHLAFTSDLSSGIHWTSWSVPNPLSVFNHALIDAFERIRPTIEDAVLDSFVTARITARGIDLANEGLATPSATWTYVITDTPFGSARGRALAQLGLLIKRILARTRPSE